MIDAELAAAMGAAEQAAIDVEQAEISVFRDDALQRKKTADAESLGKPDRDFSQRIASIIAVDPRLTPAAGLVVDPLGGESGQKLAFHATDWYDRSWPRI